MTHATYARAERAPALAPRDHGRVPEGDSVYWSRETWWCPACQPGPFPSLADRPPRPGLRRGVNEESFGSRGRRLRGEAGYARRPRR